MGIERDVAERVDSHPRLLCLADLGNEGFVYLGVDQHPVEVGDAHQFLAFDDAFTLLDQPLRAAPEASVFWHVVHN